MTARETRPDQAPDAARAHSLLVSERFVSVQGEGPSVGAPAAFLRLGRCNLACTWCDTPYSWDFSRFSEAAELSEMSFAELERWILDEAPGRLIVTGGEPLIQHARLAPLLAQVRSAEPGLVVEVETNGTIAPSAALLPLVTQWNVSPKLAGSGEPRERRLRTGALAAFSELPNAWFKFVVASEADAAEAEELVGRFGLPRERVVFMPEARSAEELRARSPEVVRWALTHRVRFGTRLHLELFGGKRGT